MAVRSHLGTHNSRLQILSFGRRGQADGMRVGGAIESWRGAVFTLLHQPIMKSFVRAVM